MSTIEQDGQRHEIIIVRRARHDEDEAHHGGVWKIAFADFMTALMCFFLVMWLINAANEETRAALASYFNPVKLIDRNSSRKGLDELGGPQSIESTPENQEDTSDTENPNEPALSAPQSKPEPSLQKSDLGPRSDEHLFSDPYAVLAEIVADTGNLQNTSSKGDGGAQTSGPASGASGGESYRDPFAPDFWSQQVNVPEAAATARAETAELEKLLETPEPVAEAGTPAAEAKLQSIVEALADPAAAKDAPDAVAEPAKAPVPVAAVDATADPAAPPLPKTGDELKETARAKPDASAGEEKPADAEALAAAQKAAEAEKAAASIRTELAEVAGEDGKLADGVSVTATDEGVVISITDEIDSGMFEIGSAVPQRDLVLAMEKIGKILAGRKGRVTINGHTDGRPFKSENYDNWRLSTARAHSAYFMLVRGGLDEQRIVEVAGFADRKLKIPADPFADANRRIEILLEGGG